MVLRQKIWIDQRVQGVLIGRIVIYWAVALLYFGLGTACFQYYQHPNWTFSRHAVHMFGQVWPWLPSLILFLPLVMFDIVRLSNLFVGPVYRLRGHLNELVKDPECRPLTFREDDYWTEMQEPVHKLQAELCRLRAQVAAAGMPKKKPEVNTAAASKLMGLQALQSLLPPMGLPDTADES